MPSQAGLLVGRLRGRRVEIVEAIFARVRDVRAVSERDGELDAEYLEGLRDAVAAAVDFALCGIDGSDDEGVSVPVEVVGQARRAARSGVSLAAVLRRYTAGHALLWDFFMQEATHVALTGSDDGLRSIWWEQSARLDRLVAAVAQEYMSELSRVRRTREQRLLEIVQALLAGEQTDSALLGYELDCRHIGVIARGRCCEETLRAAAKELDCRLLCVPRGGATIWAWLGSSSTAHKKGDLERLLQHQPDGRGDAGVPMDSSDLRFAIGQPAKGLAGWRLTHNQAQAALLVALRAPCRLTRYEDVMLLSAALKDETLLTSLLGMYISPLLDAPRDTHLRETLRAYLAAERNASSTAIVLGVARTTVEKRLRIIEERLGCPLHHCAAELEIALSLHDLTTKDTPWPSEKRDISTQ